MKKKKTVILLLTLLVAALFVFVLISTGIPCIVIQEIGQAQQRSAICEKGQPIAEEYLSKHYPSYSLESVKNNVSAMSHGKPNRYVLAEYTANDTAGTLLIDTESGQVWDSIGGDRLHEELLAFLETELALTDEYRLEVGWQILDYDEEANGGAFEEKGYYFVPADCESAEDLLDEAMITAAVKYPVSTHASRTTTPQKAQALFETYPDCNATIWVVIMDALQSEKLYEGSLLYKGYGCGDYEGAGVVRSFHLTNQ
ncbi:MAG: hypothetical protein IJN57_11280 [Oscillospiraceae bacterium]|nr:hypothetical protein [Oscillospiraceae bacterium]